MEERRHRRCPFHRNDNISLAHRPIPQPLDDGIASDAPPTLIKSLLNRGSILAYRLNGQTWNSTNVEMETFRCKESKNIHGANMYLWGLGFFTSSAIMMATIVQHLLARAF